MLWYSGVSPAKSRTPPQDGSTLGLVEMGIVFPAFGRGHRMDRRTLNGTKGDAFVLFVFYVRMGGGLDVLIRIWG